MTGVIRTVLMIVLLTIGVAACSYSAQWHYVEDPHQPGPCLVWEDRNNPKRSGVYCRAYPTPQGSR